MTHLLAIAHTGLVSGAERVLLRVLLAARDAGWAVSCCCPPGPLARELEEAGISVVPLPSLTLGTGPLPLTATALGWRSARAGRAVRAAAVDADVVLVNGLLALPAVRLARLSQPVVWLVHDVVRRASWRAVVAAGRPAVDLALCVSQAAATPIRELGMHAIVVPQGTAWPVEPARRQLGPPVIGCVALLTPWKGQDVLLDAVAGLSCAEATVELVGATFPKDAAYEQRLRQRAAQPDLAGRVRFAGQVDDALDRMRDWTVLVSPSVDPETGPLVVFEAMSVGLPVVATAHGGPLEFLGEAGRLVPPRDPAALCETLEQLLDDVDERARMGAAGRRQVAERFVMSDRLTEVLDVLERVSTSRPPAAQPQPTAAAMGGPSDAPPQPPALRVGIVSYNTAELLDRCLAALPAALDGLPAEVVVIDNASHDDSVDRAARHEGVRVERSPSNLGYAKAMNRALAGSSAPVLLALNPDTAPEPGSLATLVRVLLATPTAGCTVPVLRNEDGSLQHSLHRFPGVVPALITGLVPGPLRRGPVGRRWCLEGYTPVDRVRTVDWAVGAVHCIRAAALGAAPPYDERWFMYAEDMELGWRLRRAGWRTVLVPEACVAHVGNAAGAVAFGGARERRWLDATYDWYVGAHGATAARVWAAANVVGLTVKLVVLRPARPVDDPQCLAVAALLRLHSERVRRPHGDGTAVWPGG